VCPDRRVGLRIMEGVLFLLNIPLRFREIPKKKVWGGTRLRTIAGKDFPEGEKIGESWEISDYRHDVSAVLDGPLAGSTLRDLAQKHGVELMGAEVSRRCTRHFPILVKLIDTDDVLSVQVHPSEDDIKQLGARSASLRPQTEVSGETQRSAAARIKGDRVAKIEAWYILHAEPGAVMYQGLHGGITRETFRHKLANGSVEEALRRFEVQAGDVIFCPPGTVHAIGAGLTLIEIQQTSDTTFRLFDWNRPHSPESPRPLHIKESLAVIRFGRQPTRKAHPAIIEHSPWKRERLVKCERFLIERWSFVKRTVVDKATLSRSMSAAPSPSVSPGHSICGRREAQRACAGESCFEILCCVSGRGTVSAGGQTLPLTLGASILMPAAVHSWTVQPDPQLSILHVTPASSFAFEATATEDSPP